MSYLLVLTTAPHAKEARKLAKMILSHQLAACINIIASVESHYEWKGKRLRDKEVMLFIKTRSTAYKKLEKLIQKYHSYDVPELIALPITKGSKSYLSWISKQTRP